MLRRIPRHSETLYQSMQEQCGRMNTWASLTEEFLRLHAGEKFTVFQLVEYYEQFSSYSYPPVIIRATANKHLRRLKKEGKVLQEGWTFGDDRRSHFMVWRALRCRSRNRVSNHVYGVTAPSMRTTGNPVANNTAGNVLNTYGRGYIRRDEPCRHARNSCRLGET